MPEAMSEITTSMRKVTVVTLTSCLLLSMPAGASLNLSDDDRLALEQSLRFSSSFESSQTGANWLATMSSRLEAMVQDPFYRFEILRLVHEAATAEGLDPNIVLSLIQVESRFDRFAISVSGARGLMQVMPFWIKEIGHPIDNLFHPETNLRYGCQILKHYIQISDGNVRRALARYNGGGDPDYSKKVMAAFRNRWSKPVSNAIVSN